MQGVPYTVPAHTKNEVVEWMWAVVLAPFTKDTWVTSIEIRPSEPSVTHHICVRLRAHTPDVPYNKLIWEDKARDGDGSVAAEAAGRWERRAIRWRMARSRAVSCPVTRSRITVRTTLPS